MFLLYILAGLAEAWMFGSATDGGSVSARLATLGGRTHLVQISAMLALVTMVTALVLAVALFGITYHHDLELAVLGLSARVAEAVLGGVYIVAALGMLAVADAPPTVDVAAVLLAMLSQIRDGAMILSATCFAFGSAVFSYLFVRRRVVPAPLAWLGLAASVILVAALPVQLALGIPSASAWLPWLPMLAFEIALAVWLLSKGVALLAAS